MTLSLMEIAKSIPLNGGIISRDSGRYSSNNPRTYSPNYDIGGDYKGSIDDCDCHPGDCSDCICMDCNDCEYS